MTPGRVPPVTVTSAVPGVSARPASRYQAAPYRAMSAAWARLSTFWTSVDFPPMPFSNGRGGTVVGRASPALTKCTAADSSPATYETGGVAIEMGTHGSERDGLAARSASACSRAASAWVCSEPT